MKNKGFLVPTLCVGTNVFRRSAPTSRANAGTEHPHSPVPTPNWQSRDVSHLLSLISIRYPSAPLAMRIHRSSDADARRAHLRGGRGPADAAAGPADAGQRSVALLPAVAVRRAVRDGLDRRSGPAPPAPNKPHVEDHVFVPARGSPSGRPPPKSSGRCWRISSGRGCGTSSARDCAKAGAAVTRPSWARASRHWAFCGRPSRPGSISPAAGTESRRSA